MPSEEPDPSRHALTVFQPSVESELAGIFRENNERWKHAATTWDEIWRALLDETRPANLTVLWDEYDVPPSKPTRSFREPDEIQNVKRVAHRYHIPRRERVGSSTWMADVDLTDPFEDGTLES